MKVEDLLFPDFQRLPQSDKLDLIRHIRSDRHMTKPSVAARKSRIKKTKIQKALDKLTPEERQALIAKLKEINSEN